MNCSIISGCMYFIMIGVLCHFAAIVYLFTNACKEGDGEHVIRCWKLCMLHFHAERRRNTRLRLSDYNSDSPLSSRAPADLGKVCEYPLVAKVETYRVITTFLYIRKLTGVSREFCSIYTSLRSTIRETSGEFTRTELR